MIVSLPVPPIRYDEYAAERLLASRTSFPAPAIIVAELTPAFASCELVAVNVPSPEIDMVL